SGPVPSGLRSRFQSSWHRSDARGRHAPWPRERIRRHGAAAIRTQGYMFRCLDRSGGRRVIPALSNLVGKPFCFSACSENPSRAALVSPPDDRGAASCAQVLSSSFDSRGGGFMPKTPFVPITLALVLAAGGSALAADPAGKAAKDPAVKGASARA